MARQSKTDPLALDPEQRSQLASELQHWFQEERGERLGDLAADMLVDLIQEKGAKFWYNKGVHEARKLVRDRVERLDDDLDLLRR